MQADINSHSRAEGCMPGGVRVESTRIINNQLRVEKGSSIDVCCLSQTFPDMEQPRKWYVTR